MMARCAIVHVAIPDRWTTIVSMRCRVINSGGIVINDLRRSLISHHRHAGVTMAAQADPDIK